MLKFKWDEGLVGDKDGNMGRSDITRSLADHSQGDWIHLVSKE
jgi:hypothetical protein